MKKAIPVIIMVLLLTTLLITGCRTVVEGSGKIESREYEFSDFTRVKIGSAFDFRIIPADSFSINITTDDNMFEHIRITERDGTLTISVVSRISWLTIFGFESSRREAVIRMPHLDSLDVSGASVGSVDGFESSKKLAISVSGASQLDFLNLAAGDTDVSLSGASSVRLEGFVRNLAVAASGASHLELTALSANDAELSLSGASSISGNLEADNIVFDLSGASWAQLTGSAGDTIVNGSGASRFHLADLMISDADVTLTGASTAEMNLDGRLDISLSGASSLDYTGVLTLGEIDLSGGSSVNNVNR